jgi:hypothetical protein
MVAHLTSLVLSVDRLTHRWSDEDLQMMALWGNARANAYSLVLITIVDDRYWVAEIQWSTRPDMSRRDRERLIHRKYVLKEWVSKSNTWELEMQKMYPLNKDELAVLEYINARQHLKSTKSGKGGTSHERHRLWRPATRNERAISSDTQWSGDIISDGRLVMLAKVAVQRDRAPQLSETIINDGRMRGREREKGLETRETCTNPTGRPLFKTSKGLTMNINRTVASNATPEIPVVRPPTLLVSPMIDLGALSQDMIDLSGDLCGEMIEISEDLLVDITPNPDNEKGIETLADLCPIHKVEGVNSDMWDIMKID